MPVRATLVAFEEDSDDGVSRVLGEDLDALELVSIDDVSVKGQWRRNVVGLVVDGEYVATPDVDVKIVPLGCGGSGPRRGCSGEDEGGVSAYARRRTSRLTRA